MSRPVADEHDQKNRKGRKAYTTVKVFADKRE